MLIGDIVGRDRRRETRPDEHGGSRRGRYRNRSFAFCRPKDRQSGDGGFRPDIEGLRAVAVGAVLLYHASVPFASGGYVGVDVFFVISGFLMTRLLVGEMERTGSVSIGRFYARRIKRLLPAVVVVLATVAGLSWLLLSPVEREDVSGDLVAAGLYVVNWWLTGKAVDYFQTTWQASPVQHFWSLAVEEQFYLVWPVLLLAVMLWRRRAGRDVRSAVAGAIAVVGVTSLAYSVYLTSQDAAAAYFSTFARGWEFALGGALALASSPRLSRPAATVMAWAGMGAIVGSVAWYDDQTLFPGLAALAPAVGTAAIIVAGSATPVTRPVRLLTLAPMRHVGRISYSWYLWHWPALMFAAAVWGDLSAWQGVLVVAAAWVPSVVTYRWVETPFRRAQTFARYPRRALGLGTACTAVAVLPGLLLPMTIQPLPTKAPHEVVGAPALYRGQPVQPTVDAVRPSPRKAKKDWPRNFHDGCHVRRLGTTSPQCVYGDPSSQTTMVLFGDSHAMMYFPALKALADEHDWRLVALTKSGCSPARVSLYNTTLKRYYSECDEWREHAIRRITQEEQPDLILTSGRATYQVIQDGNRLGREASSTALEAGYVDTLEDLRGIGARVIVIRDNPHPDKDIPSCVSRAPRQLVECAVPRSTALDYHPVGARAAERLDGVHPLDPNPALCREGVCPAVIGDAIVYGTTDHLTATYAKTLTDWLARGLPSRAPTG